MRIAEVTGQNGFTYTAKHIRGDVYKVGTYLVIVTDGVVRKTLCRATRKTIRDIRESSSPPTEPRR